MVSTTSNSSTGIVEAVSVDTVLLSGSFNSNDSPTHAGSDSSVTKPSESTVVSTPLLVGIIAASVIVVVVVLLVIRSRRCRYEAKLFSPSSSTFQGVTSTTASEQTSNTLGASSASTVVSSPRPPLMETFKLSRMSAKDQSGDQVSIDIQDASMNGLPSTRGTQASRTTSLISVRSVFSASFLMRGGLGSSLPSLSVFRASRASRSSETNRSTMDTRASTTSYAQTAATASDLSTTIPIDQRQGDAWRDLSDTCWSIGPGSDSETESERFMLPIATRSKAYSGAMILNRGRLSTLSDRTAEFEEETAEKDQNVNSLDDSSRRRDLAMSALDDLSPRRERVSVNSMTPPFVGYVDSALLIVERRPTQSLRPTQTSHVARISRLTPTTCIMVKPLRTVTPSSFTTVTVTAVVTVAVTVMIACERKNSSKLNVATI
ncbi:hypothetical protein AM588_10007400 [Phytophthora nicotianae]|uniref:Uncharacterized protein n=1 Tax=Phytophthora nicotianae TaxID=4792 RepID=A0A0W8DP25_PHYNI|nr:hypothetical protein AM588_10007400 [Phytophthora nicotianae]